MALPSIEVEVTADTAQAEAGFDRVGRATSQMSGQLRRAQRSTAGFQHGIQNAAFQVGDFAVQVGGGVDASRALAQQLPQLLGGLGVFGALAGAAVAVVVPLVSAMQNMTIEGQAATEMFGTLQPVMQGIATALGRVTEIVRDFAEVTINNLDRILTIGATAAAFFAGKWVAGFVAARIATFSLAGALVTLRSALIRTGIGAIIVAAGELVFQFTRLVDAAGGFGNAIALLKDLAVEAFTRIKDGFGIIPKAIQAGAASMYRFFAESLADMTQAFSDFTWTVAQGFNELFGTNLRGLSASVTHEMEGVAQAAILASSAAEKGLRDQVNLATAPLESLQKIRDVLNSMKEGEFSLDDIIFGSDDDDKDGKDKLNEKLEGQAKRIQEHYDRIKAIASGSLSDQLGGWDNYFSNLVSLTGSSNEKLLKIAKAFGAAQALIDAWSAYNQVLADPTLPFFAKFAAGAQVLAAGIGAVNAIKSVNASGAGAGSGASGAAGGAGAASAPATQNVVLDLRNATQDTTQQVGGLVDLINEAGRQGYVLDIRTAR